MHCAQQKKQFPLILVRGSQSYLSWFIVSLACGGSCQIVGITAPKALKKTELRVWGNGGGGNF